MSSPKSEAVTDICRYTEQVPKMIHELWTQPAGDSEQLGAILPRNARDGDGIFCKHMLVPMPG